MDLLKQKMESDLQSLKETLDTLNDSVSNLSVCLQEHKEQTTAELANLKTSLNSKLDSLMATAAHLSSDHQEIQTNISNVQCTDTQQRLQNNLTHQLETIKDCIENQPVYSCGGTGGWRRVVYLDMTDPHTTCPSGWNMTGLSITTCGRNSTGQHTCSSATFPVSGGEYSKVCGRIKAYQFGPTVAFYSYHTRRVTTIDGAYACGVSLTHGTPRNHIWTFVAGASEGDTTWVEVCPCDSNSTILSLHLWGMTTSVSRESMSHGTTVTITYSTPMTHYGMERTVSPAAHVAHNIILHILPSNCRPQPLKTLKPGYVCGLQFSIQTLQWS